MIKLRIENYRAIRGVTLDTTGLSLLVGPNGSGKTTVFRALELMRNVLQRGPEYATKMDGGAYGFIHWHAQGARTARFSLKDHTRSILYTLRGDSTTATEALLVSHEILLGIDQLYHSSFHGHQETSLEELESAKDILAPHQMVEIISKKHPSVHEIINPAAQFQYLRDYNLKAISTLGSPDGADKKLSQDGDNLFTVLRNWQVSIPDRHRFEFIKHHMRLAFSPVFDDIGFETQGSRIVGQFHAKDQSKHYLAQHAAKGVLLGLLQLTAIASLSQGELAAIDDLEDGLHPHALRVILNAAKTWCDDHQEATLLIATQSPQALDFFSSMPHQVFVMRPSVSEDASHEDQAQQLTRLTDELDEEWLKHFSLGTLYGNDFGQQEPDADHAGE